jgi:threonine synthase
MNNGVSFNKIICTNCGRPYPEQGAPHRCLTCGGLFDFKPAPVFNPKLVQSDLPGLWRFRHALGLTIEAPVVYLGEGTTPLVWAQANGQKVAWKLEFINPTGSFKDRGSAVLTSFLLSRGIQIAIEDSSGNAGASFAAYAAKADIQANIFIPDSTSGPKRRQIETYGAQVVAIPGPRSQTSEAVRQVVEQDNSVYASHAYMPFNLMGYSTIAYELFEQMSEPPGTVVLPVGQGGLLLGLWHGFNALLQADLIKRKPSLVGVQARACAPLWALASYGAAGLSWTSEGETLAEGVRVSHPLRGDAVLHAVESSGGRFIAVDEEEILPGRDQLAHRGFYVEPTSAIVWNALVQLVGRVPEPIVVILTGCGLKSTAV